MTSTPDAVLATAVDLARAAVLEVAPEPHVGDHVETVAEDEHAVTHYFVCLDRGYRGWRWAATLTRTPESSDVTVAEVVLLPGSDALLAPAWVPWEQRIRPGDLGPGDLHPTPLDDPRLEPGFSGADALEAVDETGMPLGTLRPEQWELGLGRETVLSPYGRGVAADRWYDGEFGPDAPMAKAAPGHCASCGFLLPIGGQLGQVFGACANPLGADGRIVALGYGCGAHSSVRPLEGTGVPVTGIAVDDGQVEVVDLATVPLPPARPVVDDEADELDVLDAAPAADVVEVEAVVDVEAADADAAEADVLDAGDDPAFLDAGDDDAQLAVVEVVEVLELDLEDVADHDDTDDDGDDALVDVVEVLVLDDDLEDDDDLDEDDDADEDDEDDDEDELDDVVDIEPDEVL
ncbi:MAG: DUF3027 domain-containing protein [Candidatus Nanopelagicales bacterium]